MSHKGFKIPQLSPEENTRIWDLFEAASSVKERGEPISSSGCSSEQLELLEQAATGIPWLIVKLKELSTMVPPPNPPGTESVLEEVLAERRRQEAKWGQQNHLWWEDFSLPSAEKMKRHVDNSMRSGKLTYLAILLEEVLEAAECKEDADARVELIQVAAVATAAVEAIDRRAACTTS